MYDAWTLLHQVINEQNAMKAKFNELLKIVVRLLEEKMEEENTESKDKPSRNKSLSKDTKCKFFNRGFCRDGMGCDFIHPKEDCQEFLDTGVCSSRGVYWLDGKCWRKETCVYQHKALDLSDENVNDDEDLEFKKINDDDNAEDSVIESESEPQHRTDSTNDNPESLGVESISKKRELTTDEILELYENVLINGDELISTDDIIKMYETDVEEDESLSNDLEKMKKTSRKKKPRKKQTLKKTK